MDAEEILYRITALGPPTDSFIVTGGAPLAMAGLRNASDIDLFVSPELYKQLATIGWQPVQKPDSDRIGLVYDVFEAHQHWEFDGYMAVFKEQQKLAAHIDGIPFMTLSQTKLWKSAFGRPKDFADIQLIDSVIG